MLITIVVGKTFPPRTRVAVKMFLPPTGYTPCATNLASRFVPKPHIVEASEASAEVGERWMHRLEGVEIGNDDDGDPVTTAIVKPLDSAEMAAATVANRSGKPSALAQDVVQVCIDLNSMKKRERVPDSIQAESGYKAFLQDEGWDLTLSVLGFRRHHVMDLLIQRYQSDDDEPREIDGDATQAKADKKRLRDKKLNWAKRRITQATDRKAIVSHGDWIWLKEPERNE